MLFPPKSEKHQIQQKNSVRKDENAINFLKNHTKTEILAKISIFALAIIKYEKYVVKNRFLLLTSYYFIPNLFYIPRGSFFGEGLIKNMAMLIAVYVIIFSFDYMYRKIEEKKELI